MSWSVNDMLLSLPIPPAAKQHLPPLCLITLTGTDKSHNKLIPIPWTCNMWAQTYTISVCDQHMEGVSAQSFICLMLKAKHPNMFKGIRH